MDIKTVREPFVAVIDGAEEKLLTDFSKKLRTIMKDKKGIIVVNNDIEFYEIQ